MKKRLKYSYAHATARRPAKKAAVFWFDELQSRFDTLVNMNDTRDVRKGQSIATHSLAGCIAGYIDNPEEHTLFHFGPFTGIVQGRIGDTLQKKAMAAVTRRVCLFVPGDRKGGEGKLMPQAEFLMYLGPFVWGLQQKKIPVSIHAYEVSLFSDVPYRGTVWIDKSSRIFCEGRLVETAAMPVIAPVVPGP